MTETFTDLRGGPMPEAGTWAEFPGHYSLVSSKRCYPDGREVDLHGPNRAGQTYYDHRGRMWVLLAPAERAPILDPAAASAHDYQRLLSGVVSYYGTYRVDVAMRTVTHTVEAAVQPEWVGQQFVREYAFDGERLALKIRHPTYTLLTIYERLR